MSGRKVGLAKQHHNDGIGVALPNFCQLVSGVAVAGPDLTQIFARHAVEAVDCVGVFTRSHQQFVEWRPVIAPIEVEANALL